MAKIKAQVCDVLLGQKNRKTDATGTEQIVIPAAGRPDGERGRLPFDVCDEGRRILAGMRKAAEEATLAAWKPFYDLKENSDLAAGKTPKTVPPADVALPDIGPRDDGPQPRDVYPSQAPTE